MTNFFDWIVGLFKSNQATPEVSVTVPLPSGYTKPPDIDSTIRKTDIQLTKFFSLYQLTRTDHSELQEANRDLTDQQIQKLTLVAELLEIIRDIIGMPIFVDDAYRCAKLNVVDHGVSNSQHALCEAADIVPLDVNNKAVRAINDLYPIFKKIWDAAKAGKFKHGQAIFEEKSDGTSWIHLSVGMPYRDASKCGEIMILRSGSYELLDQIKYS